MYEAYMSVNFALNKSCILIVITSISYQLCTKFSLTYRLYYIFVSGLDFFCGISFVGIPVMGYDFIFVSYLLE